MKKIILLSSVLKPVTEPRMYEKIGKTLRSVKDYEVHIFGASRNQDHVLDDIHIHEHYYYNRSIFIRIKLLIQYFILLTSLKPQIIVPSTIDLCLISFFYKILNVKVRVIYDMQENFTFNTKFQSHYSKINSYLIRFLEYFVLKISNGVT